MSEEKKKYRSYDDTLKNQRQDELAYERSQPVVQKIAKQVHEKSVKQKELQEKQQMILLSKELSITEKVQQLDCLIATNKIEIRSKDKEDALLQKVQLAESTTVIASYDHLKARFACDIIATHKMGIERLYAKYKEEGFPVPSVLYLWSSSVPVFAQMYHEAKVHQAMMYVDEINAIADNREHDLIETDKGCVPNSAAVARDRLRIDTRKWFASTLLPKIYGNKSFIEADVTISHEQLLKEIE